MKKFYILLLTVCFVATNKLSAQCPNSILLTSAQKCIRLIYSTPPSPLPAFVTYNSINYNYVSGAGTAASPAEFKDPAASGACSSFGGANATITLPSGQVCIYNNGGALLPVNFISTSANINDNGLSVINWKVQEAKTDRYELEKSNDGVNFITAGFIATKGDGTNTYQFIETQRIFFTSFYRIKQIDRNGTVSYSGILRLTPAKQNSGITLYPNPATDEITLTTGNDLRNTVAELTDVTGKKVQTIQLTNQVVSANIHHLSKGLYIIRFSNGESVKLIRQ